MECKDLESIGYYQKSKNNKGLESIET